MSATSAEFPVTPVDAVSLETRAAELATRSLGGAAKLRALRLALSMVDLTTLEGADTPGKVRALCAKAMRPIPGRADVPSCAAVCVYPDLVEVAVDALRGSSVVVAAVATGFPSGRIDRAQKLDETRRAVAAGAREIDMVVDRGAFLAGRFADVANEISAVKDACGGAHLKVILETGELRAYDAIRRAAELAIRAGADTLKTSTGKITPAATLPVVLLLLSVVRGHWRDTGRRIGVKAAGGIRSASVALRHLVLVAETCGEPWLSPAAFRFGASALVDDLALQIREAETGVPGRADDFGRD